jgi:dihydropteroate synthase
MSLESRLDKWGSRTQIMAIMNVTPDSFSGDGLVGEQAVQRELGSDTLLDHALAKAREAAQEGATILDVGGESTRPGARPVAVQEEIARVVPIISMLAKQQHLPISVDSYHHETVEAALDAGAWMVNDIWGLRMPSGGWNEQMAKIVAKAKVPIILMHNRPVKASLSFNFTHYEQVHYTNLIEDILQELQESVSFAMSMGIKRDNILIDPGIGFAKTPAQNMTVLRNLGVFRRLGLPILLGVSRKSFIGQTLELPPQERDEGTAAITAFAIQQAQVDIVRVHQVRINARVARMIDALVRH